jgi:asparagine synthase (glutamine-hydrolysing)
LALIDKLGVVDAVNLFNGCFCIVLHNRDSNRLTLISDRFGFRPLFYVWRDAALIFGSELKALRAIDTRPPSIDEIGVMEFFCYGSHILDRTSLDGYLRLPPASIMTIDVKQREINSYWVYQYDENAQTLDQPSYFTKYAKLLDRAVERCMTTAPQQRIGIFLSGGYDSRSLAASIQNHHLPLTAFTFGDQDSRDMRYGSLLAHRLGFEHHSIATQGHPLYSSCRSVVWRTEGMSSFAHCTSIYHHKAIKEKMDIILLGLLGEFGGSHTWPRLLLARSRAAAMEAIFQRMVGSRLPVVKRILNPEFHGRAIEALRLRFKQSFEGINNDHPLDIADCWNFTSLQPRSSFHSPTTDRHLFEARAPHMDFDLVSFLLTIPAYSRVEQRVYKKMIAYSFPEIRDIPCTNSGLPINPHFGREYTAMAAKFLFRKVATPARKRLRLHEPLGRNETNRGQAFLAEPQLVDNILRPLMADGVFPSGIFNLVGMEQIIQEHYTQTADHAELLSLLISWGVAAKYFIYDDLSDVPPEMYAG